MDPGLSFATPVLPDGQRTPGKTGCLYPDFKGYATNGKLDPRQFIVRM